MECTNGAALCNRDSSGVHHRSGFRAPGPRAIKTRPSPSLVSTHRNLLLFARNIQKHRLSLSLFLVHCPCCCGGRMADIVVLFDFDKTIIDCDSENWLLENWVVEELGVTDLFNELLPTMPFKSLVDKMMGELHARGRTVEEIADVLKRAPIHPRIVPAIKSVHALGCDMRVVSDANLFFIETILNHLGIRECFSEINTNPGFVDGEGRLRVLPFHDFTSSSHGCGLCPPNMCKGVVIERVQASVSAEGKKKRFIYLGDGKGDYCPSLKLLEGDFMMPRKNYPVWDLICRNPMLLKAEIYEWTDGEELERVLLRLIDTIISEEKMKSGQLISSDCKLQNVDMSAHEALLPSLPVTPKMMAK